ncbi:MerR family DNA-binding transcriptional regulator [Ochrobactrum pecoris]|uniref:DNA-binding transcriptional MerR regulator n=1 Tax=Brucella pecoris TaxID=867683 RepID=A0A5C5CUM6_9HYPH|nr:MerR family DNA-binding transcriptional regulator [Brucella pecoris]MBB4092366.1 DNA-binding transcriptional MerR regulator [Brucella pecoris]NKW81955.1 MerR family DNA-binding transcriptional regulator [Brucella pecoris]TNV15212.1 MerR family DNA-binding transcriptional regulator [Brucella pecoris]
MSKQTKAHKLAADVAVADLLTGASGHVQKENPSGGQLYRIGDLAEEFDLTLRALRFYEGKGLLNPRRAGVTRLYDYNDHTRLRLILFGRRIGFTLSEMGQLISVWENGAGDSAEIGKLRKRFKEKLVELEKKKDEVDRSVDELRAILARMGKAPR